MAGDAGRHSIGIVLHTDLAEHQADALPYSCAYAQQNPFQGQGKLQMMVLAAAEDGYGDTGKRHGHSKSGLPA